MITARADLGPLSALIEQAQRSLTPQAVAEALEADVVAYYTAQRIPVQTGRLRLALTGSPRASERRVVVTPGGLVTVEVLVPYASSALHGVPRYRPVDLEVRLSALLERAIDP